MQVDVKQLFAYPIAIINLEDTFNKFFEKETNNQIYFENTHEHCFNNFSSKSINVLDGYENEKNKLMECVNFYKDEIMKWGNSNFRITTSWLTKTEQYGFSKSHSHYNSVISGVLYSGLNDSENVGDIVFTSPKQHSSILPCVPSRYTFDNCTEAWIPALSNHLILFESSLKHHIGKHNSIQPRTSLAFNTFPTGNCGIGDSSVYLGI